MRLHVIDRGKGVHISRRKPGNHYYIDAEMTMTHDVGRKDDKTQRDEKGHGRKEGEVGKTFVANGAVEERSKSRHV